MKKIIILCSLILISNVFSTESKVVKKSFGVQAGFNLSKMKNKDGAFDISDDYNMAKGFNAGLNFEIPFNKIISTEIAVLFSRSGYEYDVKQNTAIAVMKTNNIQIPILAKGKLNIGKIDVFASFGPYFGFMINGEIDQDYNPSGEQADIDSVIAIKNKISENDIMLISAMRDPYIIETFDWGLSMAIGAEIQGVQLSVNYNRGLRNIHGLADDNYLLNNRILTFNLGYKFYFGSPIVKKEKPVKPAPRRASVRK